MSLRSLLRRVAALTLTAALCAFTLTSAAHAAQTVTVSLPTFPITLNGLVIDNAHRQYPFLTYRGVTYFPLTYHDTRFLGVESQWDPLKQALAVNRSDISGGYQAEERQAKNGRSYQAALCPYPVTINQRAIDNSQELYPLLVFRDVTYFPMTWAYGVEQFGWQYQYQEPSGLSITSAHPQPAALGLKLSKVDKYADGSAGNYGYKARLVGESVYYQGAAGKIYQAPIAQPQTAKEVFQLPIWSYGDGSTFVSASLDELDGQMVLRFRQGGATMGHNESWLFAANGSSQLIHEDLDTHTAQGDGFTLSTYTGMYSSEGNLFKYIGDQKGVAIGRTDIRYCSTPIISGNKAYLLAAAYDRALNTHKFGLYEVDLTTNETRLINDPALRVDYLSADRLSQDRSESILYFVAGTMPDGLWTERNLYQIDIAKPQLQSSDVQLVARLNGPNPLYAFAGSTLYYGAGAENAQRLYRLGQTEAINPQGELQYLYSEQGYVIAGFNETPDSDTRLLVLDASGETIFRCADAVQRPQINQGRLFYITKDGQSFLYPLQ